MLTPTSINLGIAEHYLGNWCAQQLYSLALVICQETQSQRWLARCHSNLGSLFVDQSEWFRAKEHLELSYEILQKHNIQDFMADVLTSLAYVHLGYHDTDEALRLAIQAKELAVQTDLQLDLALALRAEGSVLAAQGDVSAAEKNIATES
ncbi:hypothetical protein KFU94_42690 [Chloroflexi bacterium TSY]|nr:hypothetical protein [Chloroflexi bacterium TSY]